MGLVLASVFVVTLFLSVPIGMVLGMAALAGLYYLSPDFLLLFPQHIIGGIDSFTLLAIPLFILAGNIMGSGGIARRIVNMMLSVVGRIRGGMGMVVILSTMFFSGVCGSASADTAAIGSITMPEMRKRKYPPPLATAILASAGGTSTLVPPSIDLIVIGVVGSMSIGGLFAAGILPAVVNALALMVLVYAFARKLDLPLEPRLSLHEGLKIWGEGVLALLMVVIILGGILGGVFTPTEASAVAVVYGFIVSMFVYKEMSWDDLPRIFLQSARLTGIVLLVLGMASAFSFVMSFDRIPQSLGNLIIEYADNWVVFVIFVHILFLLLGMAMDALPALIILMPILVPAGVALGMNPIHLGILIEANVAISLITPPVGICLYVACGLNKLPIEAVIKPLLPFIAVLIATLLIISYVPEITLFIPRLLGYVHG